MTEYKIMLSNPNSRVRPRHTPGSDSLARLDPVENDSNLATIDATTNISRLTAEHNLHKSEARSLLRAELVKLCERFASADRRAKQSSTMADREAAEWERLEAAGDFWAAEADLADLFLMLLRLALHHQPDALLLYLADVLRPELEPLADALANLDERK